MATRTAPQPALAPVDGDDPTHVVCRCQVDATPRLALCGADCGDGPEGITATPCVVCLDLLQTFLEARARCERCR